MKAIITKYFGPGNTRGARIQAKAEGLPALYLPYPHELSGEEVHRAAAVALANRYGWLRRDGQIATTYRPAEYELIGGGLPDGRGYAFVMVRRPGNGPIQEGKE